MEKRSRNYSPVFSTGYMLNIYIININKCSKKPLTLRENISSKITILNEISPLRLNTWYPFKKISETNNHFLRLVYEIRLELISLKYSEGIPQAFCILF